jgi:hypothetical protein
MDASGPHVGHIFRSRDVQGEYQNGSVRGYVGTVFLLSSEEEHFHVWL